MRSGSAPDAAPWIALVALGIAAAVLALIGLGDLPLRDFDEATVARVALELRIAAETVVFGKARGGADDRALLGRLWGLSGHDVATAQREQRRARREIEQQLRQQREVLDQQAVVLLEAAPRLGR